VINILLGMSSAYNRIAADLRDRIDARELAPHDPIPSERQLSADFGVSRMTARHALTVLEQEGYVYRHRTRGTFVSEPRISVRIGGFSSEVKRVGRRPGARVLHLEVATPTPLTRESLGLGVGEKALVTQRLRLADDVAIAIETSYWSADRCPGLLERVGEGSIWSLVAEHYKIVASRTEARIEAVTLDTESCSVLGIPHRSPGILLTRETFDASGACFEFARDLYRGDRSEFRVQAPVEAFGIDPEMVVEARS